MPNKMPCTLSHHLLFLFISFTILACNPIPKTPLPNVIMILADDLGYGDLGCYNSNSLVPTPNLDKLAEGGIKFTRAYCPVSVCSPSRYALMTGQYPWRSWRKSGVMRNYEPSMIDSTLLTLPEMLQNAGYTTAGFGKWHLGTSFPTLDREKPAGFGKFRADDNGANLDLSKPVTDGPLDHGFDHWYGFSCASECWILDGNNIDAAIGHDLYTIEATPHKEKIDVIPLQNYLPHIADKTTAFLKHQSTSSNSQPFFLYFAPYVPHIPLAVSEEFRGQTQAGLYGDYVHELDYYIGQLFETLERLGMKDNTIILFASDNGSQFEITSNELDLAQATNSPADIVSQDSLIGHQPNWPLRGTKWSIYEGGVRTPFIAHWQGHFPEGAISHQMLGLNDVMATLAELVHYNLSEEIILDSHSMLPLLTGIEKTIRNEIVVQSSRGEYAFIQGKWKYIPVTNNADENELDELYDLSVDESEQHNLIEEYPDTAQELRKKLEEVLRD